jgi:hypothetical protein
MGAVQEAQELIEAMDTWVTDVDVATAERFLAGFRTIPDNLFATYCIPMLQYFEVASKVVTYMTALWRIVESEKKGLFADRFRDRKEAQRKAINAYVQSGIRGILASNTRDRDKIEEILRHHNGLANWLEDTLLVRLFGSLGGDGYKMSKTEAERFIDSVLLRLDTKRFERVKSGW